MNAKYPETIYETSEDKGNLFFANKSSCGECKSYSRFLVVSSFGIYRQDNTGDDCLIVLQLDAECDDAFVLADGCYDNYDNLGSALRALCDTHVKNLGLYNHIDTIVYYSEWSEDVDHLSRVLHSNKKEILRWLYE